MVHQGRVAGVWEAKSGKVTVDLLEDVPAAALAAETERIAGLLA
ncbi:hypothetical protein FHR32_000543 [Streptosporangium album]|uniref:Winged helix DNA-binding domain-containing protein n=1 Tax=Streptosporangium album TaxID=47479 RepID=A0A7W7W6W1_9ACTN|nr:hypothetical protein [Streptosporangium album]MBB4936238.1 hypothetical protein [Streptosporangium album]